MIYYCEFQWYKDELLIEAFGKCFTVDLILRKKKFETNFGFTREGKAEDVS